MLTHLLRDAALVARQAAESWNHSHRPGSWVTVRLDADRSLETTTLGEAQVLADQSVVVRCDGCRGAVPLREITPGPDLETFVHRVRELAAKLPPAYRVGQAVFLWPVLQRYQSQHAQFVSERVFHERLIAAMRAGLLKLREQPPAAEPRTRTLLSSAPTTDGTVITLLSSAPTTDGTFHLLDLPVA